MVAIFGVNPVSLIICEIVKRKYSAEEIFYFDDDPAKENKYFNGIKVVGNSEGLRRRIADGEQMKLAISLGDKHLKRREELFLKFGQCKNVTFPVIQHESCIISDRAHLDPGNILSFGVIIGHNVHLKHNSVYWSGATIEHDCIIGESCYISPNVTVSGFVQLGECTMIGSGATILPERRIGKNCVIGAGSVVTRDVEDNSVVMGVPAKIIRS